MTQQQAPAVHRAIVEVSRALCEQGIGKDSRNVEQKFNFRGIDDVLNALSPLLVKHGLHIVPKVVEHKSSTHVNSKGTLWTSSVVRIAYTIHCAEDGSSVTGEGVGEGRDSADKSTSKAASIAYKYWAIQAFSIPTVGVLIDGDSEGPEVLGVQDDKRADPVIYEIRVALKALGFNEDEWLDKASEQVGGKRLTDFNQIPPEWASYFLEDLQAQAKGNRK